MFNFIIYSNEYFIPLNKGINLDEEIQKLLLKHCPVVYTLSGTTEKRINQIIEVINF